MWPLLLISNFGLPVASLVLKTYMLVAGYGLTRVMISGAAFREIPIRAFPVFLFFAYCLCRADNVLSALFFLIMLFVFIAGVYEKKERYGFIFFVLVVGLIFFGYASYTGCGLIDVGLDNRSEYANDVCATRFTGIDGVRFGGLFIDPNHFAAACVMILWGLPSRLNSMTKCVLVALLLSLFLSASRVALLLAAIWILGRALNSGSGIKKFYAIFLLAAPFLFLAAWIVLLRTGQDIVDSFSRFLIWDGLYQDWVVSTITQKFFGQGLDIVYTFNVYGFDHPRAPHNTFLLILMQCGVIGLCLFFLLLAAVLRGSGTFTLLMVFMLCFFLDFLFAPTLLYFLGRSLGNQIGNDGGRNKVEVSA